MAIISLPSELHLLIILANRLDPDQLRQYVGPNLDPICLKLRWFSSGSAHAISQLIFLNSKGNISCGFPKDPSQVGDSFEHPNKCLD